MSTVIICIIGISCFLAGIAFAIIMGGVLLSIAERKESEDNYHHPEYVDLIEKDFNNN